MTAFWPNRSLAYFAALAGVSFLLCASSLSAQTAPAQSKLAPIQRHENPGQRAPTGEHLAGWLNQHSGLTPAQQQQALEKEPGFHDLPAQTQERMRERLTQLNNMTPEQRARLVARTEAMEKLTPEQRLQVRTTMQQVANLPPASRRAVERAFRTLRGMNPTQREAYINSPDIRSQFTEQERGALSSLMAAEPYIPPTTGEPNP